jgi:hypothetical protein
MLWVALEPTAQPTPPLIHLSTRPMVWFGLSALLLGLMILVGLLATREARSHTQCDTPAP